MSPLSSITKRSGALAALLAAGVLAAGCGSSSDDGGGGGATSPSSASTAAGGLPKLDGQTISYIGFGGSTDEAFEKSIFADFEKQTGAKVVLDSPTDYKKIQAQVQSGNVQYDIVDGDPYVMDPQCGSQWQHLTGVDTSAVNPAFKSSSDCTVADYGYYLQIAYDTKAFKSGGPQSCQDFFDTANFPGKRAIWSYVEASAAIECAAIAAGADPKNPYPIDLDKAFAKLESIKGDLVTYSSSSDAVDKMQNSDVAMSLVTARMVAEALNTEAPVAASKAWIGRFWGSFGVPKGAPHADAAKALLAYMAGKDVNARWLKDSGGGVSNVTSPIQTANGAGNLPTPDEIEKIATNVDWKWWAANDAKVTERFGALTTG
jgi:putative spermidine/putrescine transport system substrate-binding protein